MSGIDFSSHRHTREALTTKVYGKDFDYESVEFLDLHDQWVSATSSWTFEEIRAALWEETLEYHFLGGSSPIAGWCRCGDHGDYIESFLRHYGIGATSEGEFYLLDENNQDGELTHWRGWCGLRVSVTRAIGREGRGQCWDYAA